MPIAKRAVAELLGTFWLVLGGVGSAVLAGKFNDVGIGLLGISLAFGLTVVTMAYAVGHISGGHFLGALLAAWLLAIISGGMDSDAVRNGLGSNGFDAHSPGLYPAGIVFMTEVVMTFFFLLIILGITSEGAPNAFAPLAIGLALALIHLVTIPVSATSVNPARSTGPALIAGGWAIQQLWMFWVAPILGAVLAGGVWRWLGKK
jgi:aquaporin Z